MKYRKDKYGNDISILGFGCMRFTQKKGKIDMEKAEKELMAAYKGGVNYYDTAYVYPGNEAALGEILHKNRIRDKVYIATKLPHYLIKSIDGLERNFQEQLKRLKTDRIDYYLMHMLNEVDIWDKLKAMGIEQWIEEKKSKGIIGQVGFSYHGNTENFCRIVDLYPWDFCQIQYNYMDEHTQAGVKGLRYAHEKGLPVIIMEPLRGGKLVKNLPSEAEEIFRGYEKQYSPAQWGFRWLWNQPEVSCVLSGMNSLEMVEDNLQNASSASVGELTEGDKQMLQRVADAIRRKQKVGCTGCAYCVPCPMNVDIPGAFVAYNLLYSNGKASATKEYLKSSVFRRNSTAASLCIGCGKCEQHCPQSIHIREELKNVSRELEGPLYKTMRKAVEILKLC